ncbi:MAG: DUF1848 domain-containing protein [Alphaproteobacteria bacterium]
MIVSASYRTDIPAFYADWFARALGAGVCRVANPYGGPDYEVSLTPEAVDGFVFWTRNAGPFRGVLAKIAKLGTPFVVQYTVTGYPRALETSVTAPDQAIALIRELADIYGPRAVVWRYDPILLTSLTPAGWHRESFARLARALSGVVDEVVLSFAQIYAKTQTNVGRAARRHGFTWEDPAEAEKRTRLAELAAIAADLGLKPVLCAQPELLTAPLRAARCIDAGRLSDIAGKAIPVHTKGNRPGCYCAESRDIGAYDTCPHGCVYCYAVRSAELAKRNYRAHDPGSAILGRAGATAQVSG